jgi:dihydroorotate dehydrogenase (NAD+) catalytic subunit
MLISKMNKRIARYLQKRGLNSVGQLTGQLQLHTDTVLCG